MTPRKLNFLLVIIFLVYAFARISTNLPALEKPRELADTKSYLRVSQGKFLPPGIWLDDRSFVFPLLLKIAEQDVSQAAALQLGFSVIAWAALAYIVSASLRPLWLKLLSFGILLTLSLVRYFAGWDYVMMTESLSISWFVLFLALGIWLTHEWKMYKVLALIFSGFFLAFTRDTNAYLLLMISGLLIISVLFRWSSIRVLWLAIPFLFIFFFNNYTSDLGSRWVFPINNVVGRRILVRSEALGYFQSCGMPVTPELLSLRNEYANGRDRAFYNDPALEGYRQWLAADGKSCYMKWLLADPARSVSEVLFEFDSMMRFEKLLNFLSKRYDPLIPYFMEPVLYPVKLLPSLWLILTVIALRALWMQAWKSNKLWGIHLLLCLPILPHLFITWHGDAMAPDRHALSVGLQIALSFWLAVFLLLDRYDPFKGRQ